LLTTFNTNHKTKTYMTVTVPSPT